ncbi:uncharacterized protein [Arachis hypogaea]|uniref:uncharacterized protein n=1 Tax=Arachis hypogaea TaxID=3818 RepID=UPI003B21DFC6
MKWFDSLLVRSVISFDNLSRKYLMRFSIQKDKVKYAPSLLRVKQEVGEPLRDYMKRFNKACLEIQDLSTEAVIIGLVNGLQEDPFSQSISKRNPTSLSDVQERAEKYINMEENARLRETSWRPGHSHSSKERKKEPKKKEEVGLERPRRYHSYTPLRVSLVDTTPQSATGETPFRLAYDIEDMIPIEINEKSPRVSLYDEVGNIQGHIEELELLLEVREQAQIREAAPKQRMTHRYNKKVI